MTIDGGRETVSGVSPGNFTSLHVDMGVIFVGGTPLGFPPTNLIRYRTTGEEVQLEYEEVQLEYSAFVSIGLNIRPEKSVQL